MSTLLILIWSSRRTKLKDPCGWCLQVWIYYRFNWSNTVSILPLQTWVVTWSASSGFTIFNDIYSYSIHRNFRNVFIYNQYNYFTHSFNSQLFFQESHELSVNFIKGKMCSFLTLFILCKRGNASNNTGPHIETLSRSGNIIALLRNAQERWDLIFTRKCICDIT